jgi:hypothetical protein
MTIKEKKLRVGDWVEVRGKEEILATLDAKGELDGMPFMPEMFAFCGKQFQVYKRAHKTCDTVFPVRGRRVHSAIHLDTRCDGSSHGGCQAGCLLFWKQAWLKPLGSPRSSVAQPPRSQAASPACTESAVFAASQVDPGEGSLRYVCQATRLPYATTELNWWELGQYFEDYSSGNITLWQLFCGAVYFLYFGIYNAGIGLGRPMRWFYDKFHALWRGTPFPRKNGVIPSGEPTPAERLDVQPGELVRIKSYDEILQTINTANLNRGLYFDAEEVPYCGETHRVLKRVTKIIDEKSGKMIDMKTPCVVLDSVICKSRFSECRLFCPRSIYAYWREIWLERVDAAPPASTSGQDRERVSQCEPVSGR